MLVLVIDAKAQLVAGMSNDEINPNARMTSYRVPIVTGKVDRLLCKTMLK